MSLRVLTTNLSLSSYSGTEMYTRDLALELCRRGHQVTVYSPLLGDPTVDLRAAGIRVIDQLNDQRETPDVIHGHHHVEVITALLRFPGVPAVFVCHDRNAWHDRPPLFPRIRRYVAVDENCRERFAEEGIEVDRQHVILNAVDLERFRPRGPLPSRPKKALLFSHYAAEHTHLPVVRETCRRAGIALDVVGGASGRSCARPEAILGNYDLVFAKARCAQEAMAVGCAVVLCDSLATGPLVEMANWERLRPFNFGRRTCAEPLTVEALLAQVARYDSDDAGAVCHRTRRRAGLPAMADQLVAIYQETIQEQRAAPVTDLASEMGNAAEYLRRQLSYTLVNRLVGIERERDHWQASAEFAHRGWAELDALRKATWFSRWTRRFRRLLGRSNVADRAPPIAVAKSESRHGK